MVILSAAKNPSESPRRLTVVGATLASPSGNISPMFCPSCKTEYRPGFTHCADCDVDLVNPLPVEESPWREAGSLVVIWRGSDPVALSRAMGELEKASIRFWQQPTETHTAFGLGIPRPIAQIYVLEKDLEAARTLVSPIEETPPFGDSQSPVELFGKSDFISPESGPVQGELPASRNPATATEELWSGADADLAEGIGESLRENGIQDRTIADADGRSRIFVASADLDRAREILREIIDATPPE